MGAERLALVDGAERLAGVLDQREAVLVADRAQLVELARIAEDVDGDDRLRPRVIAASTASGSRFSVSGSMSAKTGVAPA